MIIKDLTLSYNGVNETRIPLSSSSKLITRPVYTYANKGHIFCSRCRSYKVYRLLGKRYRCQRCNYTFHDLNNRWINKVNISPKQWLWIIKLFELDISTRKIAQQIRLSYPTVLKFKSFDWSSGIMSCRQIG